MKYQSVLELMRLSIRKKCAQIRIQIDKKSESVTVKVASRSSINVTVKTAK